VGSAAVGREGEKVVKYSNLSENYHFVLIGIETFGAYGPQAFKLIKQTGKKIQEATGEKKSTFYPMQSISMAIQKDHTFCVSCCPKKTPQGLEGLFNFHVKETEKF
jgi:hypothetical protein